MTASKPTGTSASGNSHFGRPLSLPHSVHFGGRTGSKATLLAVDCEVETRDGRRARGSGSMPLGTALGLPLADAGQLTADPRGHEDFGGRCAALAIAAVYEHVQWTYQELEERANQIAGALQDFGPGSRVAVFVDRSLDMLAALYAVMKTGAAYVPIDPSYPKDRIAFILDDAEVSAVLTVAHLAAALPPTSARVVRLEECRAASTLDRGAPEDTAYVIYTSGSTGKPKGVPISHRSLMNLLFAMARNLNMTASDSLLAVTTICFDIAGLELFAPLVTGGRVILASRETACDGAPLASLAVKSGATILQATPATWELLLGAGWTGKQGFKMVCGGEAMPLDLARKLAACGTLWNAYGPTETTIWSSLAKIERPVDRITIGRALANTTMYVLDENRQPVPAGVPGELYIGGVGLTTGYWKRPELTEKKLVANPFGTGSLYRTGDLVRYLPDGELEFLGRIDNQVKIRGFRIEPGEIEEALRKHPAVSAAVVTVNDHGHLDKRLVAHVVLTHGGLGHGGLSRGELPDEAALREFLKAKVPAYMMPSTFVSRETLPHTPNGKVDRNALAALPPNERTVSGAEPRGMVEVLLLQIWEDILRRRPIGVDEDFFDLGGHSLLGMRLIAAVERAFQKRLTLVDFFEAPTVRKMAELLRSSGSSAAHSRLVPISSSGSGQPLFLIGPQPLFRPLILRLAEHHPVIAFLQPEASSFEPPFRIEDIAAQYIRMLREYQPHGPYSLAGWCVDGVLAFEMAQQLRAAGEQVPSIVLIDSFNPARWQYESRWIARRDRLTYHARNLAHLDSPRRFDYLLDRMQTMRRDIRRLAWRWFYKLHILTDRRLDDRARSFDQILAVANRSYVPRPYDGHVVVVRAGIRPPGTHADAAYGWRPLLSDLNIVDIPADHRDIFIEPNVQAMASAFSAALSETEESELVLPN